ncbi:MAG TPA: MBOAT family O-acyltransferase [Candidatus Dormibacteraeota bacterium]|nr:MBOAT family O-acyltransferase [Candidatus Dormibacteraeota bacterium]
MFQSIAYVVGFLACVLVFAKVHSRGVRQAALLLANYALYLTWAPWFAAVLFASTLINYLIGKWLRRKPSALPLATGIALNLTLLGVFKYLPEAAVQLPFSSLQRFAHLALPLGISFWTFQALSYLLDLYREEELDPSFVEFALYMAFFPVTISGPVCRMPDMLPQLRSERTTSKTDVAEGLRRIAIGVFMMQLAKLLGQGILAGDGIVSGFDRAARWSGPDVWCLAFGYGLQLFFDFAGYSHVAIGAAKALGFTVPENFQRPFASTTPSIFWTRWHMSLSFWIRDYLFLPFATARREIWWRNLALVLSMVAFGLWHRATLLFFLWGFYHGVLLVAHRLVQQVERKLNWHPPALWTPLSWIATISLVSLGWIFFRADSWSQARQMLSALASPTSYASHFLSSSLYLLIVLMASGYALVLSVSAMLDRHSESAEAPCQSGVAAVLARWRWFWIPPLYVLALLFVWMITLTQSGGVGQLMYRSF